MRDTNVIGEIFNLNIHLMEDYNTIPASKYEIEIVIVDITT